MQLPWTGKFVVRQGVEASVTGLGMHAHLCPYCLEIFACANKFCVEKSWRRANPKGRVAFAVLSCPECNAKGLVPAARPI